jgi:predicted TIM-barrel fold metal-dependent hydrolase
MGYVDADTHLDETEATWEYVEPGEEALKPQAAEPANLDPNRRPSRYWLVDGRRQMRFIRDDAKTQTTVGMRELFDVPARLRAMDEMGVDIQVMYPTMFLVEGTDKPEVELAMRRSYNRWVADRTKDSGGRLRWVCLPPTRSMDKAIEELRFAKDHGACGVMKKGNQEADHWVAEEYFHPLYEEAEKLDLPICFHTGSGVPDFSSNKDFLHSSFLRMQMPVPTAMESLVTFDITSKFPKLRFGFIEAGCSWVPFMDYFLKRRESRKGENSFVRPDVEVKVDNLLQTHRFYVTCQVDEDLPYILQFTGEDNLLVGSDFVHADFSAERDYAKKLKDRVARGELPESFLRKVMDENPRRFYGL